MPTLRSLECSLLPCHRWRPSQRQNNGRATHCAVDVGGDANIGKATHSAVVVGGDANIGRATHSADVVGGDTNIGRATHFANISYNPSGDANNGGNRLSQRQPAHPAISWILVTLVVQPTK